VHFSSGEGTRLTYVTGLLRRLLRQRGPLGSFARSSLLTPLPAEHPALPTALWPCPVPYDWAPGPPLASRAARRRAGQRLV